MEYPDQKFTVKLTYSFDIVIDADEAWIYDDNEIRDVAYQRALDELEKGLMEGNLYWRAKVEIDEVK